MRFAILGPLEVERDGQALDLGTPKQRALLLRLLLEAPRPVSVDRIVEDLWSGTPPGHATASLQAYVSNLRRVLEPDRAPRRPASVLVTRPPGYLLRLPDGDDALDAARFRALAARAGGAAANRDHAGAHVAAVEALALWRGPALLDVRDEPFAAAAVTELEDLRLAVHETRLAAALGLGRAAEVAADLESLVAAEPLRERLWELLALALYRDGRSAAALARLRRIRRHLGDELGMEPGPRLQRLEQAILRHDDAVLGPVTTHPGARPEVAPLQGGRPAPAAPPGGVDAGPPVTPAAVGHPGPGGAPLPPRAAGSAVGHEAAAGDRPGLDATGRPPLMGRDTLLDRLAASVRTARTAGPRWLLLTGDAGMGKSRLAEALRDRARDDGWRVVVARCHDDPDTPSFWVWAQVLRELGADAADPLPALAATARAESGGDTARFAMYDGVRRGVERSARTQPLLVVVDDLQWADGDSLRALRFLAVQLADVPVVLVATVRDGEPGELLAEVLATVGRRPGAEEVALPPVDAATVRGIAEALTGGPVTDRVVADLHARSGGNPLFATELARLPVAPGGARELPSGVREVVGRRLARLPDEVRRTLATAAVVGEGVDVAVLAGADGVDVPTMLERLDPAVATGVLVEDGAALRVRFAHAVLRESLLAGLGTLERRRVHARIAAALGSRHRGTGSPELAHHLVEAGVLGDPRAARDAAVAVARQAVERLAFDEAARWFGRALEAAAERDAVDVPDPGDRYGLLLARGDALYRSGQVLAAREALVDAVAVAMELDDLDAVAGAAAALTATGGIWTWVDIGEVPPGIVGTLRSVLNRLGDRASAARARLLSTMATGLYYGDDWAQVDALSAEAVTVARGLDDPGLLADVLLDRAFVQRLAHGAHVTVALAEEALRLPGLTDLQVVVAHGRRLFGLLQTGDLAAAVDAHRQAADLARTAHLLVPQMQLSHFPAGMAAAEGRYDDAERLLAQASAREELVDLPRLTTGVFGLEAVILKHRGRLGVRAGRLQELAAGIPLRTLHQLAALALVAADDPDAAREAWQRSVGAPGVVWLELLADTVEVELREALLPRPATPSAEDATLLRELRSHEHMIAAAGTAYPWVPVGLPLGALEHRLGLLDDAEAHLRRTLARTEEWGTHTWSALARWRLAAVLEERGERAQAAREAARARADADRIGLALPPVGTRLVAPGPA